MSTAMKTRWVYSDIAALSGSADVHIRDEAQLAWLAPSHDSRVERNVYLDGIPREVTPTSHYGRTLCGLRMTAGEWWFVNYDNGRLERCGLCDYLAGRPS